MEQQISSRVFVIKQWIEDLELQRSRIEKQITTYKEALEMEEGATSRMQKTRNVPKGSITADLENKVGQVFANSGNESMKLVEIIRAVNALYPENERVTDEVMRARFQVLKKSGFIVPSERYGFHKLGK